MSDRQARANSILGRTKQFGPLTSENLVPSVRFNNFVFPHLDGPMMATDPDKRVDDSTFLSKVVSRAPVGVRRYNVNPPNSRNHFIDFCAFEEEGSEECPNIFGCVKTRNGAKRT